MVKKGLSIAMILLCLFCVGCGSSNSSSDAVLDQEASQTLVQYVYENYGGAGNAEYATSWYGLIQAIEVYSNGDRTWAEISADIYPDTEGKELGEKIGTIVLTNSKVNLNAVTVHGQEDSSLYSGRN